MTTEALFPLSGATARFDQDGIYRYELSRRWASGPTATFVMLNPSTADAVVLDPTVRRCCNFAKAWGMGGLLVTNLFGLRSTDPAALKTADDPVGPENDDAIHDSVIRSRIVVVAWGAHSLVRDRASFVLGMIAETGREPRCLGTTKGGYPRHPLYVPSATPPIVYEP